ncbi:MAG: HAD family hydrolase [Pseudomonadales bacterium]|nr:HAD family hydrolase [Pseudomonadales bacterium]
MENKQNLLVLDVDNTLLQTVLLSGNQADSKIQCKLLFDHFEGCCNFKGEPRAVIVPRPHLHHFTEFLGRCSNRLDIGIYSTGTASYLSTVLSSVFPWAIGNSRFIWGINYCDQINRVLIKDLNWVSEETGYPVNNIRILDDSDVVRPAHLRIPIEPFKVVDIPSATKDEAFLEVIVEINLFIST